MFDKLGEGVEVGGVETFGGTEREVEAVGDEGEMVAQEVEFVAFFGGGVEVVVGGDFEEVDGVPASDEFAEECGSEPQADAERGQVWGCVWPGWVEGVGACHFMKRLGGWDLNCRSHRSHPRRSLHHHRLRSHHPHPRRRNCHRRRYLRSHRRWWRCFGRRVWRVPGGVFP